MHTNMLTERELVQYLVQLNLLSNKQIIDGDLFIMDVSRRNRNMKIISEHGPCYFIKQGVDRGRFETVASEARFYELFLHLRNNSFDHYLPHYRNYDTKHGILILELVSEVWNLGEYYEQFGHFPISIATEIGKALSILHCIPLGGEDMSEWNQSLVRDPPFTFSLHHPDVRMLRRLSSTSVQMIKIIQRFPDFTDLLDKLREEWRRERLIHFDLRWDNFICLLPSGDKRKLALKIIDWELACIGDPCWDIGSVFAAYLGSWLFSIPITGGTPVERFAELARFPLDRMQPAIRSFWQSYVRRMNSNITKPEEWLHRSVRYAAVRLIQTAFERTQMSMQLTSDIICMLQLSLNILQRPQEAIISLLGVPFSERTLL